MSELLWTLSLLAQKHLAQSPSAMPQFEADVIDAQRAIAKWEHINSLNQIVVASTETTTPEFSKAASARLLTVQSPEALPGAREISQVSRALQRLENQNPKIKTANNTTEIRTTPTTQPEVTKSPKASGSTFAPSVEHTFHVPADVAASMPLPELLATVSSTLPRPTSGDQLYAQRLEALRAGKTYTRLPSDSFQAVWQNATYHPQYEDWLALLAKEADAMSRGQGHNHLTIMIGDSLSQWFPNDQLPSDRFWLNQGISGDTSAGVLRRLSFIDKTNPDVIHVMVGINDLRAGATDAEVLANLQQIMHELHQRHPAAQIYVHSLLPTRLPAIPNERITELNAAIAQLTETENVAYLDLQTTFADADGNLRLELTTDGLHLSRYGYALWQSAMRWFQLA